MTFELSSLGQFKVERTKEYWDCPDGDKTYCGMIRVKGSTSQNPYFKVPSHLYKYSETELGLYLKDKKNLWRKLGTLLGEEINIHDDELVLTFPITKFPDVSKIVPFVQKRGRKKDTLSDQEREIARQRIMKFHKDKMRQKAVKSMEKSGEKTTQPTHESFANYD